MRNVKTESDYIVSYDIADNRRLQRLAKQLEKVGIRIQFSVFLLCAFKPSEIYDTIETIKSVIDENEDDVRVYRVRDAGLSIGQAIDIADPYVF